jgi:hypothetical protein
MAWPGSGRLGHSLPPDRRGAAAAARCLWTGCAAEQGQQAVELADDQEEQAKRNGHDRAGPLVTPITVGQELRPTSGTHTQAEDLKTGPEACGNPFSFLRSWSVRCARLPVMSGSRWNARAHIPA